MSHCDERVSRFECTGHALFVRLQSTLIPPAGHLQYHGRYLGRTKAAEVFYRHISITDEAAAQSIPNLRLLGTTVGVGLGGRVQLARPRFTLIGAIVSSLGLLTDLSELSESEEPFIPLVRGTDFNLEVKLAHLTLGFTFRSQRWANQTPESFDEVIEAVSTPSSIPKRRGQRILRLGINW